MRTLILGFAIGCFLFSQGAARGEDETLRPGETRVPLTFVGGHETDPRDHGRPVVLIAAALGVPATVFRDAFSHVRPAPAGERPDPAQVQENKRALLDRLASFGVTNERLDQVSNYYRYRPESGNLWRHADAAGYAIIKGHKVVRIVLQNAGSGYSSAPVVSLKAGLTGYPLAHLVFGKDLAANGSIHSIDISPIADRDPQLQSPQYAPDGADTWPNPDPGVPPPLPPTLDK